MKASVDAQWARYGRALISSMSEVLDETRDDIHSNLLETADYWLSLGLVLGLREPDQAPRLLQVIQAYEAERGDLTRDSKTLRAPVFIWTAAGWAPGCTQPPDRPTILRPSPRTILAHPLAD